jgi:hypothetical protein
MKHQKGIFEDFVPRVSKYKIKDDPLLAEGGTVTHPPRPDEASLLSIPNEATLC